jgi:glyoxylase-like metal-dependent hydrolase (beta-lactamase superfamily II)
VDTARDGAAAPHARATLTGNAGVLIDAGPRILIDCFFTGAPGVGTGPLLQPALSGMGDRADLILVTHAHFDHFDPEGVAEAARRTQAVVAGPAAVVRALDRALPAGQLVELEPAERKRPAAVVEAEVRGARVVAMRTRHGGGHNSYLVEAGAFRFFHDCDNEDTRVLDRAAFTRLDCAFVCPWQGGDLVRFLEDVRPARWVVIHLDDAEVAEHRRGRFLPGLMERVPEGLVFLAPGESLAIPPPPLGGGRSGLQD